MPASDSAGDLLLVALKMPPSRIGTYSNFTPVRFSIAGIASWLRKALGLPKSNRNCGLVLTAVSPMSLPYCGATGAARPQYYDAHNTVDAGSRESNQPLQRALAPDQCVIARLQNEHGAERYGIGGPDAFDPDGPAQDDGGRHFDRGDGEDRQYHRRQHGAAGAHCTRDDGGHAERHRTPQGDAQQRLSAIEHR